MSLQIGGANFTVLEISQIDPTLLTALTGSGSATGDLFYIYDVSVATLKKITRAELLLAIDADNAGAASTSIADGDLLIFADISDSNLKKTITAANLALYTLAEAFATADTALADADKIVFADADAADAPKTATMDDVAVYVLQEGFATADTALADADKIMFLDATDSGVKTESVADLALYCEAELASRANAAIADGDKFVFSDVSASDAMKHALASEIATYVLGKGITIQATASPTATENDAAGYLDGHIWIELDAGKMWFKQSDGGGTAVWIGSVFS